MAADGIAAYDVPRRIAAYDRDMDVMHPNRHRMVRLALDLLPFDRRRELSALDLGAGTGFFTRRLLDAFPKARVIAVDGAAAMIEVARDRPLTLHQDLEILRAAGLTHAGVFWLETREAVTGGVKEPAG